MIFSRVVVVVSTIVGSLFCWLSDLIRSIFTYLSHRLYSQLVFLFIFSLSSNTENHLARFSTLFIRVKLSFDISRVLCIALGNSNVWLRILLTSDHCSSCDTNGCSCINKFDVNRSIVWMQFRNAYFLWLQYIRTN